MHKKTGYFEGKAFLPSQLQNSLGGEDFSRGSSLERCEQKTARAQPHQQPWASHITPSSLSLGFLLIKWALLAHSHLLCSRTQRQMRGRCYPHKGQWFLPTLFYKIHYLYFWPHWICIVAPFPSCSSRDDSAVAHGLLAVVLLLLQLTGSRA